MQQVLETIQKHAKELKKLEQSEQYLFEQINSLSPVLVKKLIEEFTPERFQPVNLLRLDILNKIQKKTIINSEIIEEIKTKIIEKDESYFQKYGETIVAGLKSYSRGKKRGPFASWKHFSIFFPFFYTEAVKKETNDALSKITESIVEKLKLYQYNAHVVDFYGPQNFGTSSCWIAGFPKSKVSHRKAYQLFLRIHAEKIEAGIIAGWDINDKSANTLEDYNTIDEVIEKLKASKSTVEGKNTALINYWKFAPGENGIHWDEFYKEGIIAIGWDSLSDLKNYTTESLAEELNVENTDNSNQIWNIENFRDASIGDVIIANKGKSKSLGIGVVTGKYKFEPNRKE